MSQFFERNKKKGALALLLLYLKKGQGIVPMVVLTLLLAAIFIVPGGYNESMPWLGRLLDKVGLSGLLGRSDGPDFKYLNESLSNIRRPGKDGLRMPGADGPPEGYGKSSVGYVKDGGTLPKDGSVSAPDLAKGAGKTVDGVLRPEDSKKMAEGVSLKEDELHNGLTNNALAGAMAGMSGAGGPGALAGQMGLKGGGVTSGSSFGGNLNSGRADDKGASMMKTALNTGNAPGVGSAGPKAGAFGKVGWRKLLSPNVSLNGAGDPTRRSGNNSVMFQLAQGRAYSVAAAPPPGYCGDNCPKEYASNASGVVFDGGRTPAGNILSAAALGDPTAPTTPDSGTIGTLGDQASQLEADQKKCEAADQNPTYGVQAEQNKMNEIQNLSNQLNSMNCNGGGCGGNASSCKSVGDQMKQKCQEYNQLAQQHANACPLTNGKYTAQDCNAYY